MKLLIKNKPEDQQHLSVLTDVIDQLKTAGVEIVDRGDADGSLISFAQHLPDPNLPGPIFYIPHGIGVVRKYLYLPEHTFADVIFHSGTMFADRMKQLYPDYAGQNIVSGFPKIDNLQRLNEQRDEIRGQLIAKYGLDPAQPIFLFAPTWRTSIVFLPDLLNIPNLLVAPHEGDYIWADKFEQEARIIKSGNINNLLVACDALITDFSSVAVEALVLDKPIIQLVVGAKCYISNVENESFVIGPQIVHGEEIGNKFNSFEELEKIGRRYRSVRRHWMERLLFAQDGQVAKRIANEIIEQIKT